MEVKELKEVAAEVANELKPLIAEQSKKIEDHQKTIELLKSDKEKTENEFEAKVDAKVKEIIRTPEIVKEFNVKVPSEKSKELDGVDHLEEKTKFALGIQLLAAGRVEKALNYLAEGTTAGTFVPPKYIVDEIIMNMGKFGLLGRIGANKIPVSPSTPTVYLGGLLTGVTMTKTSEGSALTQSEPTFEQPSYTIDVWGAICSLTNQVLSDAQVLGARLPIVFGEAAAKALDLAVFNSTTYGLVQKVPTANVELIGGVSLASAGALTFDNLVNLEGLMDDVDLDGAVYIGSKAFRKAARLIKDNENRPVLQNTMATADGAGKMISSINGIPLYTSPVMPDGTTADAVFAVLCNPSKIMNYSVIDELAFETFRSGTDADSNNAITKNLTILRALLRAGFLNYVPRDIAGSQTGLVGLKTTAS